MNHKEDFFLFLCYTHIRYGSDLMKELTLKVEQLYGIDEEFNAYMLDFNGVKEVNVDKDSLDVYIKYDEEKISINRIKLEALFFLGLNTIPSLRAFDKHSKEKLKEDVITIECLCCEYCLRGMIEELLAIDGIDKASSDYDYIDNKNIHINISYNDEIITEADIKRIEKEMNEY